MVEYMHPIPELIKEFDVNFCYPREDTACDNYAEETKNFLEDEHKLKCSLHWRDWLPGGSVFEIQKEMIKKSKFTIFLLCQSFLDKIGIIDNVLSKRIIIIKIDRCEVPEALDGAFILDHTNKRERPHIREKLLKCFLPQEADPYQYASITKFSPQAPASPSDATNEWEWVNAKEDGLLQKKNNLEGTQIRSTLLSQTAATGGAAQLVEELNCHNCPADKQEELTAKLLRENLPTWENEQDILSTAECTKCEKSSVCRQAIHNLRGMVLRQNLSTLKDHRLAALQKCLEALGLQDEDKKEAIREDVSQELADSLLFVAGLMSCQFYFIIKCKPIARRSEAARTACKLINSGTAINRIQCSTNDGSNQVLNNILQQIWSEIEAISKSGVQSIKNTFCVELFEQLRDQGELKDRGEEATKLQLIKQLKERGKEAANKLSLIKQLALITAAWSKITTCESKASDIIAFLTSFLNNQMKSNMSKREMLLTFAVPALLDITKNTAPGDTDDLNKLLNTLEQISMKMKSGEMEVFVRKLSHLLLHQQYVVRNRVKEIWCIKTKKNENTRMPFNILVRTIERNLDHIPVHLTYPPLNGDQQQEGCVQLSGQLCEKRQVTVEVAWPSLKEVCKWDDHLRDLERRRKTHDSGLSSPEDLKFKPQYNMRNELKLLLKLKNNDKIIQLLAYRMKPMPFFYVLERAPCGTLEDVILRHRRGNNFDSFTTLLDLVIQAAEAVKACHDMNILVLSINTASFSLFNGKLKLTNLKLAKSLDSVDQGNDQDMYPVYRHRAALDCLPTRFMPPEILRSRTLTKRTDSYTFGFFIYQLITYNSLPFGELDKSIEEIMQKVITGCYRLKKPRCMTADLHFMVHHLTILRPSERIEMPELITDLIKYKEKLPVLEEHGVERTWLFKFELPRCTATLFQMEKGIPEIKDPYDVKYQERKHTEEDPDQRDLKITRSDDNNLIIISEVIRDKWTAASAITRLYNTGFTDLHFTDLTTVTNSPALVKDHDVLVQSTCPSPAEKLPEYINSHPDMTFEALLHIFDQITAALMALSNHGFVIGDLHPNYIYILDQDPPQVKVAGYGMVQELDEDPFDDTENGRSVRLGTTPLNNFRYKPLETLQAQLLSVGGDVYNLGVVMWAATEMYCQVKRTGKQLTPLLPVPFLSQLISIQEQLIDWLVDDETLPEPSYTNLPQMEALCVEAFFYDTISRCLKQDSIFRPSFSEIRILLQQSLNDLNPVAPPLRYDPDDTSSDSLKRMRQTVRQKMEKEAHYLRKSRKRRTTIMDDIEHRPSKLSNVSFGREGMSSSFNSTQSSTLSMNNSPVYHSEPFPDSGDSLIEPSSGKKRKNFFYKFFNKRNLVCYGHDSLSQSTGKQLAHYESPEGIQLPLYDIVRYQENADRKPTEDYLFDDLTILDSPSHSQSHQASTDQTQQSLPRAHNSYNNQAPPPLPPRNRFPPPVSKPQPQDDWLPQYKNTVTAAASPRHDHAEVDRGCYFEPSLPEDDNTVEIYDDGRSKGAIPKQPVSPSRTVHPDYRTLPNGTDSRSPNTAACRTGHTRQTVELRERKPNPSNIDQAQQHPKETDPEKKYPDTLRAKMRQRQSQQSASARDSYEDTEFLEKMGKQKMEKKVAFGESTDTKGYERAYSKYFANDDEDHDNNGTTSV